MIKVQIHYTTIDGVKKSKVYSYVNPAASDVTIKDFANALNSLTTNTTGDIYKIDTAILLDDDSDDIVTPIVTTEPQSPGLILSPNSLNFNLDCAVHEKKSVWTMCNVRDVVTVTHIGGDDCAKFNLNISSIDFTATSAGSGTWLVSVDTDEGYPARSGTVTISAEKHLPFVYSYYSEGDLSEDAPALDTFASSIIKNPDEWAVSFGEDVLANIEDYEDYTFVKNRMSVLTRTEDIEWDPDEDTYSFTFNDFDASLNEVLIFSIESGGVVSHKVFTFNDLAVDNGEYPVVEFTGEFAQFIKDAQKILVTCLA